MNDDAFEDKLRALASRLERPDPTPRWKADILASASRARDAQAPAPRTPRWLLTTLGAAWLLIAVLRFTTPSEDSSTVRDRSAAGLATKDETPLHMLMAFRSRAELLDIP